MVGCDDFEIIRWHRGFRSDAAHRYALVEGPVSWTVRAARQLGMDLATADAQSPAKGFPAWALVAPFFEAAGQKLLDPAGPNGWKEDRAWVNSNTIRYRTKLAAALEYLAALPHPGHAELRVILFAAAHSLLLGSVPAANAVIASPDRIELRFNNRIEPKLSRIRLVDERGARRDLPVSANGTPDRVSAPLSTLTPGPYRVEWQVLSTDGHIVSGRFSFRVAP